MRVPIGLVSLALLGLVPSVQAGAQESSNPRFRSGVELVSVSAVVRDGRGRLVPELTREDFSVLDGGEPRPIIDFLVERCGGGQHWHPPRREWQHGGRVEDEGCSNDRQPPLGAAEGAGRLRDLARSTGGACILLCPQERAVERGRNS